MRSLEYSAPESLPEPSTGQLLQVDSKADMWSLGMILHKLLFFRLPYLHTSDNDDPSRPRDGREYSDKLEAEILNYRGFVSSSVLSSAFESRRLPKAYLLLLETLLNIKPSSRPSSERVLGVIKEGRVRMIFPLRQSCDADHESRSSNQSGVHEPRPQLQLWPSLVQAMHGSAPSVVTSRWLTAWRTPAMLLSKRSTKMTVTKGKTRSGRSLTVAILNRPGDPGIPSNDGGPALPPTCLE